MSHHRTLVHQLLAQAERLKDRPAQWTRRGPAWRPLSWRAYAQQVKELACGLMALGFGRGDALAILAGNREEWAVACLAAMAAGGRAVGVYTTASQEQLAHVLGHCGARFALAENAALLERVREAPRGPTELLVMESAPPRPAGARTFEEALDLGRQGSDARFYEALDALRDEDVAQLIYTSGTTGPARAVEVTHRNLTWTTERLGACHPTSEQDVLLSYLPLAHVAEQVLTLFLPLSTGMQVFFARGPATLADDLLQVRPTVFFGVPRVWEKLLERLEQALAAEPRGRQRLVAWAREVTGRFHREAQAHLQSALQVQAGHAAAQALVHRPVKARLGLDRARIFAASAAPMARPVLEGLASLDLVVAEVYGLSEATGPVSVSVPGATRLGAVGRPMPGVEVRLDADGEILVRGGNVCRGYLDDPDATRALLAGGWLRTGDLGALDQEGFLSIVGRKKEILVTSGGQKAAPAALEQRLTAIEPLGPSLVVGEGKPHLGALLTLDRERVEAFARARGWPLDPGRLAVHLAFRSYLKDALEREVNSRVARHEAIRRFEVLPQEFSPAGGELTATFKLRRAHCLQKYAPVIDRLYADPR